MENNSLKTILQTLVDENISPNSVHVWPGVKDRLVARNHPLFQQGKSMKPNLFSRRAPLALMTAVVLLFALAALLVTPTGRALAQQILRFFNRTESNTLVLPTVEATLAAANPASPANTPAPIATEAGCGSLYAPRCQVAEIQPQVGFPIQALTNLPDDIRFVGAARYQGGVVLSYEAQGTLLLIETPETQDPQVWQVSKDAVVEAVTIGSLPGEYVQGGWMGTAEEGSVAWDATLPTQTLRWSAGGIRYTLTYLPGKVSSTPHPFELKALVAMAAGIKPADQADLPAPASADLNLPQIEQQAGFPVAEPSWLPPRFGLRRAVYNSQYNAACLYYDTGPNDVQYPMVIFESSWALPTTKDLRPVVLYDGKVIEVPKPEAYVTVRGADGEQGLLASNGLETSKVCGGESLIMNTALLWTSGYRSFILFGHQDNYHGEGYVTQMEMIRMAEMLNGTAPSTETANSGSLDPQRLFSVRDAETVSGSRVLSPTRMLDSLHLDHIAFQNSDTSMGAATWPNTITTIYTRQSPSDFTGERITISQVLQAEWTLAQRELEGGFTADTVRGQPALYQELCWQAEGQSNCHQTLIWREGSTSFEISTNFPALLPRSLMMEIAESMR